MQKVTQQQGSTKTIMMTTLEATIPEIGYTTESSENTNATAIYKVRVGVIIKLLQPSQSCKHIHPTHTNTQYMLFRTHTQQILAHICTQTNVCAQHMCPLTWPSSTIGTPQMNCGPPVQSPVLNKVYTPANNKRTMSVRIGQMPADNSPTTGEMYENAKPNVEKRLSVRFSCCL